MTTQANNIYTSQDIRELERIAIDEYKISAFTLMQRAGSAAFSAIKADWPNITRIVVYCGKGNNGGDGYILAHLAKEAGCEVYVRYLGELSELSDAALQALQKCQQKKINIQPFDEQENLQAELIVDALLGTGLHGSVEQEWRQCIEMINQSSQPVVSLDIPSGLSADTGNILGCAIEADATITFIGLKQGLLTADGLNCCGKLMYDDLQIPSEVFAKAAPNGSLVDFVELKTRYLPKRNRNAHKGNFGHVLVIGGDFGMAGATRMAAEAAAKVGAGLVSVATHPEHVAIVSSTRPELMCHGLHTSSDILPLFQRADVLVFGPGLGMQAWGKELLNLVLSCEKPMVIDADGLNLLALHKRRPRPNWVLTPHPGEAARLLGTTVKQIQENRFEAAKNIQKMYGGVCVLKGAGSIIQSSETIFKICVAGNPGMATGGMGDVLSGVIAGLMAQGIPPHIATELGVTLHAMAADESAQFGERGMLASDLMPYLRRLVN